MSGLEALRAVCSSMQWRITELRLRGLTRAEVARELGVAPGTVRSQVNRLREKRLPYAGRELVKTL